MRKLSSTFAVAAALCALPAASYAQTVLKASHQFPGGKGDVRDEMVQMIAREAKAANVGLEVQVFPGAALFKPNEQWNALVNGQLDISSFPLDYASGKVRAFGATLMPGLVRSHDRALAHERLAVHEEHQGQDRQGRRGGAVRRVARGRRGLQEGLRARAQGHRGAEDPLRRAHLRRHVAEGRRLHRLGAQQRGLQRAADRRRRRHRHQHRQLRLVPHLRAGEVHHRARRQRAVVHVRAGADVQEELRPPRQEAAAGAARSRQEGAGVISPSTPRASTRRWSRSSRATA